MPPSVQQRVESFFGADFSDVRIHVGQQASSIGALAFTAGSEIFFAPGQYDPQSPHGLRILGHELTHVVQQRAGRVCNPFGSGLAVVQDTGLEAEAERMGLRLATSIQRMQAPGSSPRLQSPALRPGGIIIQPKWVFVKGEAKLFNLSSDAEEGLYTDSNTNKKYRSTGKKHLTNDGKTYEIVEEVNQFSQKTGKKSRLTVKVESKFKAKNDSQQPPSPTWSCSSLDSDEEKEVFKESSNTSKQPGLYQDQRYEWDDLDLRFNSSEGLSKAVEMIAFGGEGQFAANTHALWVDIKGDRYMVQSSTANAMKAMVHRFKGKVPYPAVNNVFKGQHVHTEMYLLWKLTGGNAKKIPGCLKGYRLYVDKPVCNDCYPYVKSAKPDAVRDGTDFYNEPKHAGRGDYYWKNPFDIQ